MPQTNHHPANITRLECTEEDIDVAHAALRENAAFPAHNGYGSTDGKRCPVRRAGATDSLRYQHPSRCRVRYARSATE